MKKLLILSAIVGCGLSVYAQGVVSFVTTGSGLRYPGWATNKTTVVGWLAGSTIPASGAGIPANTPFRAALYGGQVNDASQLALLPAQSGNAYAGFNTAGLILGSTGGGNRVATFTGAGFAQVRAWSGAYATYEEALAGLAAGTAGYLGASSVFAANFTVPPATPGSLAAGLGNTSFLTLEYVPEPSVLVLAALGLGSLVYLRRRK